MDFKRFFGGNQERSRRTEENQPEAKSLDGEAQEAEQKLVLVRRRAHELDAAVTKFLQSYKPGSADFPSDIQIAASSIAADIQSLSGKLYLPDAFVSASNDLVSSFPDRKELEELSKKYQGRVTMSLAEATAAFMDRSSPDTFKHRGSYEAAKKMERELFFLFLNFITNLRQIAS